jgi:hypothetical protein
MEHYERFSGSVPGDGLPEDIRNRRFWNHLSAYYDNVVALIHDTNVVQIFGPWEAKHELKKRLEREGLVGQMVSVDNADKLSDLQIATRVRARFSVRFQYDLSWINASPPSGGGKPSPVDGCDRGGFVVGWRCTGRLRPVKAARTHLPDQTNRKRNTKPRNRLMPGEEEDKIMDSRQMLTIVEHYCQKIDPEDKDIEVTRVADRKSVFAEQIGKSGRAVMMPELKVDGATYCADTAPAARRFILARLPEAWLALLKADRFESTEIFSSFRRWIVRLNLLFILMDLLTLLAYPFVIVHGILRQFSKPKGTIPVTNLFVTINLAKGE